MAHVTERELAVQIGEMRGHLSGGDMLFAVPHHNANTELCTYFTRSFMFWAGEELGHFGAVEIELNTHHVADLREGMNERLLVGGLPGPTIRGHFERGGTGRLRYKSSHARFSDDPGIERANKKLGLTARNVARLDNIYDWLTLLRRAFATADDPYAEVKKFWHHYFQNDGSSNTMLVTSSLRVTPLGAGSRQNSCRIDFDVTFKNELVRLICPPYHCTVENDAYTDVDNGASHAIADFFERVRAYLAE